MSYNEMDDEQQALMSGFVEEGLEMLDEVEPLLIELEKLSDLSGELDLEVMNTIFRLFHSLKGSAGFLGLSTVSGVTHEAETLLDMFRKGTAHLDTPHIDILNRTCDFIRKLMDNIELTGNDTGFEDEAKGIIKELVATIATVSGNPVEEESVELDLDAPEAEEETKGEAPIDLNTGFDPEAQPADDVFKMSITPEMIKQYVLESMEQLEGAEEVLLKLEKDPTHSEYISQVFRNIHSFKGNSGFLGYKDLEKLSHHAETVLDSLRDDGGKAPVELFTLLLDIIDFLKGGVTDVSDEKTPRIPSLPGLISLLDDSASKIEHKKPVAKKKTTESSTTEEPKSKTQETTVQKTTNTPTAQTAEIPQTQKDAVSKPPTTQRQSVRVDVEKLDFLLDLVGELVIAEAMVSQNPDIKGLDVSLDRFEKSVLQLDKITRDLQDIATSIRMVPLAGTFRKMIRLVRDLSQKAGKKINLEIIGEDTEVDKTVIEQITDPLVHIIRNSIDHGVDLPEERLAIGKSETGNILIEAKYVGSEVWIQIKDDGRGLNREKILKKAIERELIQGDGSDLKDEDVWPMIFLPGFSTADKITDISGRGVGMDVVRRNIENIRGKVDVNSESGKGSTVVLRIPLTLAIIDGMLVRVGTVKYTIPIVAIKESFQPGEDTITRTMDGREIITIREELFPVVRLHELFGVESDYTKLTEGILLLIENEGKQVCLFVDEIIEQQQVVIKGLSTYVGNIPGVSGCTILGDGAVCLIIDIMGIVDQFENASLDTVNTEIL